MLLKCFAELANFVLQLGDLRLDPLVLFVQPAFMLKLHGEGRHVGKMVILPRLAAALVAPLAALGIRTSALAAVLTTSVLPAPLIVGLPTPGKAFPAAERDGDVDLLAIASDSKLSAGAGLSLFDGADQVAAVARL